MSDSPYKVKEEVNGEGKKENPTSTETSSASKISDWQKKLNDLEDLEQRANLVANHMADKYPSRLAGDDALDRTNDVDYKNLLKPTASPDYDGPKLTGTNMRIKAMRENERRRTTEEKIKRVASLAPLNATKSLRGNLPCILIITFPVL